MTSIANSVLDWVSKKIYPPQSSTPNSYEHSGSVCEDDWHKISTQPTQASAVSNLDDSGDKESDVRLETATGANEPTKGGIAKQKRRKLRIMHHMVDGELHAVAYGKQSYATNESGSGIEKYRFHGLNPAWDPSAWYTEEELYQAARTGTFGNDDDVGNPYLRKAADAMTSRHVSEATIYRGETALSKTRGDVLKWQFLELPEDCELKTDSGRDRVLLE